jgi:hypothetical protein
MVPLPTHRDTSSRNTIAVGHRQGGRAPITQSCLPMEGIRSTFVADCLDSFFPKQDLAGVVRDSR